MNKVVLNIGERAAAKFLELYSEGQREKAMGLVDVLDPNYEYGAIAVLAIAHDDPELLDLIADRLDLDICVAMQEAAIAARKQRCATVLAFYMDPNPSPALIHAAHQATCR